MSFSLRLKSFFLAQVTDFRMRAITDVSKASSNATVFADL